MACENYPTDADLDRLQDGDPYPGGYTDETGRHFDAHNNQVGFTLEDGRYHDANGNTTGWTDDLGGQHGWVPFESPWVAE